MTGLNKNKPGNDRDDDDDDDQSCSFLDINYTVPDQTMVYWIMLERLSKTMNNLGQVS
jgi:hypothetical protein